MVLLKERLLVRAEIGESTCSEKEISIEDIFFLYKYICNWLLTKKAQQILVVTQRNQNT